MKKKAENLKNADIPSLNIADVVRSCYWCDVPITDSDEVEELPDGRGEAHKTCADEWYGCQMAED